MSSAIDTHRSPSRYCETAIVAKEAGDLLLSRLDWMLIEPKLIVDMGCGPGVMNPALKRYYPNAVVLGVDDHFAMLSYAAEQHKVASICADVNRLPYKDQSVDIIFANFILPWQQDPTALLQEWHRILRPEGILLFTAFGPDTLKEWQPQLNDKDMPQSIDMHEYGDLLLQLGFKDPVLDVNHYVLTYKSQATLFQELHASQMWLPNEDERERILNMQHDLPLEVTYEVVFAHAFVGNKQSQANEYKISISQLRQQLKK